MKTFVSKLYLLMEASTSEYGKYLLEVTRVLP